MIPLLYSLVFGESVLNDAVAIALCSALEPYVGHAPELSTLGHVARDFVIIVLGSVGVGLALGLLSAFVAAREKHLNLSTTYQMMQILVLAYFSYVLAEYCKISGVISLFVCALVQSHYCWYSVSEQSRRALFQVSGALDYLSELLVFLSLGILLFSPGNLVAASWNVKFILTVLAFLFIARAVNVFGLSFLLNLCRRKDKIPLRVQFLLWWCGMRGIVTLLLVLNFHTPNRSMLINTTFVVVFFTNIFIGLLTRPIVKSLNVGSQEAAANLQDPGHALPAEYITRAELNSRSTVARLWFLLDNKVLKKAFGGRARIIVEDESEIDAQESTRFARPSCSSEFPRQPHSKTSDELDRASGEEEPQDADGEREDESEEGVVPQSTRSARYLELDVTDPHMSRRQLDEEEEASMHEFDHASPYESETIATASERALAMIEPEPETPVGSVRHYGSTR